MLNFLVIIALNKNRKIHVCNNSPKAVENVFPHFALYSGQGALLIHNIGS